MVAGRAAGAVMSTQVVGGVFISYSSDDRAIVTAAARLLRAAGAKVFQDVADLEFGSQWERALMQALAECERVMVFWSASAARSTWVEREWRCALQAGKRVVPMQLDKTPLPAPLAALHGVPDLVDMLRDAMQPGPAQHAGSPAVAAPQRIGWMAGLGVSTLGAAAGLGWWLLGADGPPSASPSPDDFGRGLPADPASAAPGASTPASPPAPASGMAADMAADMLPPASLWLLLGAVLLLGLALVWRQRRLRRLLAMEADPEPTLAALPQERLADLGTRFAAALFNEPPGR